ncbi:WecB/TagA/CpsF family glycosyltransferase [Rhodococcus sp. NPDC058521]|uniref:WecB/TagA/CpsF family glycosyltransferase n=1 Tax=Rhodococcus sp. NPDC058521 TaxID=3346536 RepID=UPI00364D786D
MSPGVEQAVERGLLRMVAAGTTVELCSRRQVLDLVRTRAAPGGRPLAVGSVNLDHLHHFRADNVRAGTSSVDWAFLADGQPVVRKARTLTGAAWERLTGADLLPEIIGLAETDARAVGFLGGTRDMHVDLRSTLLKRWPDLRIGGFWAPERAELTDRRLCAARAEEIAAAGVDVLVVGLGKPRQENWIERYGEATDAGVLLAFGASADFLSGRSTRAPEWYREHGLEWLHRLTRDPRRLSRRYLVQAPRAFVRLQRAHIELATSSPLIEMRTNTAAFTTRAGSVPNGKP